MTDQEYPVTRLQAAKWLRQGYENLDITISRGEDKPIKVICYRSGTRVLAVVNNGPRVRLNWKQALGLLRRNYVRSYMETV